MPKRKRIKPRTIDESYLIKYKELIFSTAKRFRKYFSPDDLVAVAQEGFLLAYHTWNKAYWKFDDYAVFMIDKILSESKKHYGRDYDVESGLSLDIPFSNGKGCMRDCIHAKPENIVSNLYFDGLCSRLDERSCHVLQSYLIMDASDNEVMEDMRISNEELEAEKQRIKNAWREYDDDLGR